MTTQQKFQYDWKKKFLPWSLKAAMKGMGKGVLTVNEQSLIFTPEKGGGMAGADIHSIRALRAYQIRPPTEPAFASFVPQDWDLKYMEKYLDEDIDFIKLESDNPDTYMRFRCGKDILGMKDQGCETALERIPILVGMSLNHVKNLTEEEEEPFLVSWRGDTYFNYLTGPYDWPCFGNEPEDTKEIVRGYAKYDAAAVRKIVASPPLGSTIKISDKSFPVASELGRFLVCIVYLKCREEWHNMLSLGLDVAYSSNGEIKNMSFTIEEGQTTLSGDGADAGSFIGRILGLNPDVSVVGERTMKPEEFYQYVEKWRRMLPKLDFHKYEMNSCLEKIWDHLNDDFSVSLIQAIWYVIMEYETLKKDLNERELKEFEPDTEDFPVPDPYMTEHQDLMEQRTEYLKKIGLWPLPSLDEIPLV